MQEISDPSKNRRPEIVARVAARYPHVREWSISSAGLTPTILALATPQQRKPNSGYEGNASAIAVAYVAQFSATNPSPPKGRWWGFRQGSSQEVLDSRQLLIALPPVTGTKLVPITGDTSAESAVVEIRGNDAWSTSPIPLDRPVEFAVLMGRGVPTPESLAVQGTRTIEPFLENYSAFLDQYAERR